MPITEIFSFILASTVLAFTPGPDVIFVIVTSLGSGFKTAFKFILGLCAGIILHTSLIIVGISTIISQSESGLAILKYFAICYLLYLAFKTFQHRKDLLNLNNSSNQKRYFIRGFVMNVSNPKVLLFFLAFFPQFANLEQTGYQFRLLILGLLFIAVTLIVFSFIAWFSAKGSQKFLKNPKYSHFIHWLATIVFVGVSILLLLN